MSVVLSHQGYVCTDCQMMIANSDSSGILDFEAWQKRVEEKNATENGKYHVVPECDLDPRFSSMGCDFCGINPGGMDVHLVSFLEEVK